MKIWTRAFRGLAQRAVIFPLAGLAYRLEVDGREHLAGVWGPFLLVANHNLHLDNALLLKALPGHIRRRTAIAARAGLWRNRFWAVVNPLLGNGFPFATEGPVRPSLENLGRLLDDGWSVLIYPEGELTMVGPMKPFKGGTGLLAIESGVPVVPIRLHVQRLGTPWQYPILRRGHVRVRFGEPLTLEGAMSYTEATTVIESAVQGL